MQRRAIETILSIHIKAIFFIKENLQRQRAPLKLRCAVQNAETIGSQGLGGGFEIVYQNVNYPMVPLEDSEMEGLVPSIGLLELYKGAHH